MRIITSDQNHNYAGLSMQHLGNYLNISSPRGQRPGPLWQRRHPAPLDAADSAPLDPAASALPRHEAPIARSRDEPRTMSARCVVPSRMPPVLAWTAWAKYTYSTNQYTYSTNQYTYSTNQRAERMGGTMKGRNMDRSTSQQDNCTAEMECHNWLGMICNWCHALSFT